MVRLWLSVGVLGWVVGPSLAVGQRGQPINLVQPKGTGRIVYRSDPAWKIQVLDLLDDGTRPVLQLGNDSTKVDVSYLMFVNDTGRHDSESCRRAVVDPIMARFNGMYSIKNDRSSMYTTRTGKVLAVRSYLVAAMGDVKLQQENLFGFYGDASTCFEVHVSKYSFQPGEEGLLEAELERFDFEAGYRPTVMDYFQQGEIFFRGRKAPGPAAFYYRSALDGLPATATDDRQVTLRRVLTDQLVMSYGIEGEFKKSRALAAEAIAHDPEYPLNYYNLACADAEQGHAADARVHLQQAFDRKANTLPGEKMPDPTKDESFQKLKKNKEFWTFVQGFSTPMELKSR